MPWCFGSQVFDVAELRLLAAGKAWETGKKMETDTGHRTEAERRSFFLARLLSVKVSLLFHRADGASNPRRFTTVLPWREARDQRRLTPVHLSF
jgi:hypothetical protein